MYIEGTINRVLFHNKENHYTVASLNVTKSNDTNLKKNLNKNNKKVYTTNVNVVGVFDREPIEDEGYSLEGDFVDDPKFGYQFRFKSFKRHEIHSYSGLISYLSSDVFEGIGLKKAKDVVNALGIDAIAKIKKDPKVLENILLSDKEKQTLIDGIMKDHGNQDAMIFLLNHGITSDMAVKIISVIPPKDLIPLLKENPYILIDKVKRFGFKKADAFAQSLGFKKNAVVRISALLRYGLNEILYQNGNSYINKYDLYNALVNYLQEEINRDDFENILRELHQNNKIYVDEFDRVFDYQMRRDEIDLSIEIVKMLKDERCIGGIAKYSSKQIDKAYDKIAKETNLSFSNEQIEAIKKAFTEPIVIITGGPGTGKTTIIHAIIRMYQLLNSKRRHLDEEIALLAPTGRAAKRLYESTSLPASTIHRFLGYGGEGYFEHSKYERTEASLIIVDEASMMDLPLASRLVTSMKDSARIIIVGDVDQLPSVGPGQVLKDLIDTGEIKTIRLTKIHRQKNDSSIIGLAHEINNGYLPENILDKLHDRNFIRTTTDLLPNLIVDLFERTLKLGKELKNVQILIPMYKGSCGITEINKLIQERINPFNDGEELRHYTHVYRKGDKVIQLVNRPEKGVMNGDIGYICGYEYKDDSICGLNVTFDIRDVTYKLDELDDLSLAYAISIHKSQGSEFDIVIMPFTNNYYIMLKRKLIYTGITRAKKSLILIGDPQALSLGIKKLEENRLTILKDEIIRLVNGKSLKDELKRFDEMYKDKELSNDLTDEQTKESTIDDIDPIGAVEVDFMDN